jgi:D-threo-aldose 1-dehydrogenase
MQVPPRTFDPFERVNIASTGVEISRMGVGGGPLGNLQSVVTDANATFLLEEALGAGIRYFDTAPLYGMGLSEQRIGRVLSKASRTSFVLSTKVGRLLRRDAEPDPELFHDGEPFFKQTPALNPVWDFSYQAIIESLHESMERLGLSRVEIGLLHEPPESRMREAAIDGYRALRDLRDTGELSAIGVGWDNVRLMSRLVAELDFDCVLVAGRYTLLDQSALAELLPLCLERRVHVIMGGVFNSGILASRLQRGTYDYLPPSAEARSRTERIGEICDRWSVPARAAALQFPLAHPAVSAVVLGMRTVAELRDNIEMMRLEIPRQLWPALKDSGVLPSDAPTPDGTWLR